jgi:hypothetical protein
MIQALVPEDKRARFNLDDQVLSFNLENRSMPQESIAAPHLNHFATSKAMDVAPHALDRHSAR